MRKDAASQPAASSRRLPVDEVMRQVRAEVARRRGEADQAFTEDSTDSRDGGSRSDNAIGSSDSRSDASLPEATSGMLPFSPALGRWRPAAQPLAEKQAYVLSDLLPFADADFVATAFTVLLRRDPLPAERSHYLASLRTGAMSKIEVLADIRWSLEGERYEVHVDGLLAPYMLQRAQRWPVIGPILAWALALARLPATRRRINLIEASLGHETHELGSQLNSVLQNVESSLASLLSQSAVQSAEFQRALDSVEENARQSHHALHAGLQGALDTVEADARASQSSLHGEFQKALERLEAGARDLAELQRVLSIQKMESTTLYRRVVAGAEQSTQVEETLRAHMASEVDRRTRMEGAIDELRSGLATGTQALGVRLGEEVANLASRLAGEGEQRLSVENAVGEVRSGLEAAVATLNARIDNEAQHGEHLPEINDRLSEVITMAQGLRAGVDQVQSALADKADLEDVITVTRQLAGQRSAAVELQRRFGLLLEEARRRLPEKMDTEQVQRFADEENHRFDGMYASFEEQFRGTRDNIRARARHYLDAVRSADAGTSQSPVLDLGCGRGEWLELLRDEGLAARGVDLNDVFLAQCRTRGLDVIQSDVVAYLRELPEASMGAITSMHLVEHLPMADLVNLLDECARVLRPGGVIALETPNPENLLVGSHYFYMDPTHRNPIPPSLLQWLVEARGFEQARVDRLSAHRGEPALKPVAHDVPGAVQVNAFVALLNQAPDYAVIAFKPPASVDDEVPVPAKKQGSKR